MFIGKICNNLIKIREASFAKSILAAIVIRLKWDVIQENCACFAECFLFLDCITTEYIPGVL